MNIDGSSMDLGYCMNVHPGESWADCRKHLEGPVLRIRDAVAPNRPFGLGMRLSAMAVLDLEQKPADLEWLRHYLADHNLYVFTVNAFPYGRFHGGPVKKHVYEPDWRTDERVDYTLGVARILAALNPTDRTVSISTVPGSFGDWIRSEEDRSRMIQQFSRCAAGLKMIEDESGVCVRLAIEPEPACFLETMDGTLSFFKDGLFLRGREFAEKEGLPRETAETLLRRHLGVCLDTCHAAVEFEDPLLWMQRLREEDIRLAKVQISSAIRARPDAGALDALSDLDEPVYLHQVVGRCPDGSLSRWLDLPGFLTDADRSSYDEVRVHFHVPLFWEGDRNLQPTAGLLGPEFMTALYREPGLHVETETYTYDVLPESWKAEDLPSFITRELNWLIKKLPAADGKPDQASGNSL